MKTWMIALVYGFALMGCKNACEKAADRMTAAFEDCGIEVEESDEEGEEAECTKEDGEAAACMADCVEATPCEGLTGEDTGAALEYAGCALEC